MQESKPYKLLKLEWLEPSIIFCRYPEVGVSQIRSHKYVDAKVCKPINGWDASSLYLYCSGQEMPCDKESYVEVSNPRIIKDLRDKVMTSELFRFLQVGTHVPDGLQEKFNEFFPLFIVDEVPEDKIPQDMKDYQKRTDRKTISGTKKIWEVTRATEILLFVLIPKW